MSTIPADALFTDHRGTFVLIDITKQERVRDSGVVKFGIKDWMGREIGNRYTIDRETCTADPNANILWDPDYAASMLGETFLFQHLPTRDDAYHGCIPVSTVKRFRTLEEAEAHAEIMIKGARARARKRFR